MKTIIVAVALTLCVFNCEPVSSGTESSNSALHYKAGHWSHAKRTVGGSVSLIRRNESYLTVQPSDYPNLLVVVFVFKKHDTADLPNDDAELQAADKTEQAIADALFERYGALFTLTDTHDRMRALYFSFSRLVDMPVIGQTIRETNPKLEYHIVKFANDPSWRVYHTLSQLNESKP